MSKPWHAKPPISLAESEGMLCAKSQRQGLIEGAKSVGGFIVLLIGLGFLAYYLLSLIFRF